MPEAGAPKATGTTFECSVPILRVRSLKASLDYYVSVLGFRVDWREPDGMASVSRDGIPIMLCEGAQGSPGTWVWFGVGDAEALFREYTAAGATIRLAPTNYRWAYEMQVEDPDGHVLRFGSEPKTDRPFATQESHTGRAQAPEPPAPGPRPDDTPVRGRLDRRPEVVRSPRALRLRRSPLGTHPGG